MWIRTVNASIAFRPCGFDPLSQCYNKSIEGTLAFFCCFIPCQCHSSFYYLIYDVVTLTDILIIWHWYVILDTWYPTLALDMLYLTPDTWHLIPDTGTWHVILDTWYLTLTLDMLYLTLDIWHRHLTCYIWHPILDT